ncbi:hypothetical protein ADL22_21715 [Streptomyces sp. NRRL F-4489]|uniref:hypothetical protein n=1 Tax=Streptomyces sp. NRRL F-4489 TaxID=1609095 RepID=UPI000748BC95|nr:hypothetical protein [Streptomyces sp. NRRL F-4489]KUL37388.1 hypothetical protein ADL22_21715 [Streptomyces sp. NRRL F-4489]
MDAAGSAARKEPGDERPGEPVPGDEGEGPEGEGEGPEDEGDGPEGEGEGTGDEAEDPVREGRTGLTPRQARRVRVVLASVLMAAVAVVLVIRLASRHSVLVVGVYGAALVLCGIVIELARNGRTRLGTWLLGVGLAAAIAADWLLLP